MKINKWIRKNNNIKIKSQKEYTIIHNLSDTEQKIYSTKLVHCNNEFVNIDFNATLCEGAGSILKLVNRNKECKVDVIQGSKTSSIKAMRGYLLPIIIMKPHSSIKISNVQITKSKNPINTYNKFLGKKKILLITPSYPSPNNLYACRFVHSRVKEYINQGIDVEVVICNQYNEMSNYEFEGVNVYKTDYSQLRSILMFRKYDAILVHFFDEKIAYYLETSYLKNTPVVIWNHGADILYWNYKEINTQYFSKECDIPKERIKAFKKRDYYVKKYSNADNFYWIFVSEDEKRRAEQMHNITFKNSSVIPNLIDTELFQFKKKDPELRKNVFLVRKFDNYNNYAIDIAVLTILELSRRKIFNDMQFYICGEGNYYDELVLPIKNFQNVHLIHNFLTHEKIKEYHDKCGIAFFPTRSDTQGVSTLEAASSGLAVVTSDIPVMHEYFDESLNILCKVEDYKSYADVIERIYNNPKEFSKISEKVSQDTKNKCDKTHTIDKEIQLIKNAIIEPSEVIRKFDFIPEKPLLTITIPSYNSAKFLNKCLESLLTSEYSNLTEILIINDGSKDETEELGKYYEDITKVNGRSIVKIINKENGGHGSGINKGIELARGKYFKVIDADDWVDEKQYNEFLKKLQKEDADLVLTDYSEARTSESKPIPQKYYDALKNDITYNFNDVCQGNYGFKSWGPILSTSTYKVECLRKTNFKLLEHTFYVDMTYNAYSIIGINSIIKYDLNVYRYYVGNAGQSISQEGMMKHYKDHENVIMQLMNIVTNDNRLTDVKRDFIKRKLLLPMVYTQYYIILDLFHSRRKFLTFEKRAKKYPQLMQYHEFNIRNIKFNRYTKGIFVPINPFLKRNINRAKHILSKIKNFLKKCIRKTLSIIRKII